MSNHQQVTIVRDTAESNREVDALAVARAEAAAASEEPTTEAAPTSDRPEWLPSKFSSPADLAKAYSELEKKVGGSQPTETPAPAGLPAFDGLGKYSDEFMQNGDLSEESFKAITGMGFPEPLVRAYVEGQKAVLSNNFSNIMSLAGGEKPYNTMIEWAATALEDSEIDAFNKTMDSADVGAIRMAVQGLKARFDQANGTQGRLIQGETSGPSGGAFQSVAQIVEAMKDPRYAKDPAYRRDVEQRVALSNAFGVNR